MTLEAALEVLVREVPEAVVYLNRIADPVARERLALKMHELVVANSDVDQVSEDLHGQTQEVVAFAAAAVSLLAEALEILPEEAEHRVRAELMRSVDD